jgi:hypothetical protein
MVKTKSGKVPSGWCITGHHPGCPKDFAHGTCVCDCHSERKSPRVASPEIKKNIEKKALPTPRPSIEHEKKRDSLSSIIRKMR